MLVRRNASNARSVHMWLLCLHTDRVTSLAEPSNRTFAIRFRRQRNSSLVHDLQKQTRIRQYCVCRDANDNLLYEEIYYVKICLKISIFHPNVENFKVSFTRNFQFFIDNFKILKCELRFYIIVSRYIMHSLKNFAHLFSVCWSCSLYSRARSFSNLTQ